MSKPALGFIGLGNMGGPMSARLVKAGHEVFVYDRDEAALARAVAAGCQRLNSIKDVADQVDTVILSLPTPDIVKAVALNDGGLKDGRKAQVVVDLSDPGTPRLAAVRELRDARASAVQFRYLWVTDAQGVKLFDIGDAGATRSKLDAARKRLAALDPAKRKAMICPKRKRGSKGFPVSMK